MAIVAVVVGDTSFTSWDHPSGVFARANAVDVTGVIIVILIVALLGELCHAVEILEANPTGSEIELGLEIVADHTPCTNSSTLSWDVIIVDVLSSDVARKKREEGNLDDLHVGWSCRVIGSECKCVCCLMFDSGFVDVDTVRYLI